MKDNTLSMVTPQRKIISVTDRLGNQGIRNQQGTTRIIYDTLPLDGRTQFRFFEESNNRNFPLTNMGSDGNKLPVGNALAIERMYLAVVTIVAGNVTVISPLFNGAHPNIEVGELSILIANSQVLKQMAVLSQKPTFNKNAGHNEYNNFEFDTQLVINPLLEFVFDLKANTNVAVANTYLRLTVEGVGAIIAPRTTM